MYKITLYALFCFFIYSCSVIIPLNNLPEPKGEYLIGTDIFSWEDTSRDEWFTKNKIDSRSFINSINIILFLILLIISLFIFFSSNLLINLVGPS